LVFNTPELKKAAFTLYGDALRAGNGLAAKWAPREKSSKGAVATELRKFFGLSSRSYRKKIVELSSTVEELMCSNKWDDINFSHVPSVASARYRKAFNRHTVKFAEYIAALVKKDPSVKVNANAIYPHDVIKGLPTRGFFNSVEMNHIIAQWDALPNYVGDANILPLVDVSGSMTAPAGKNANLTCLDVAVSLGLYVAEKNTGKFKDTFLTFSSSPELLHLKGNIVQKVQQMSTAHWEMSTNLHAALDKILQTAISGFVPQGEMPEILLIFSDMQFNQCIKFDDTAMEMIERKYMDAGYQTPQIVFWNLRATDNVPVKADKSGAALVSGFSPAILKAILSANPEEFSPMGIMLRTIMDDKYSVE
jgi:hypothetical protein